MPRKKIAILGFDREGRSTFRFLREDAEFRDAEFWILDKNESIEAPEGATVRLGEGYLAALDAFGPGDVVFRTPGARYHMPELSRARERGVTVTSATRLFFARCPGTIIGVTGTKGKGTTSSLIYAILKADGRTALLAGNIGVPALDILPKVDARTWVVLELSSFQLIDLDRSPHIAVALMVTSEHLDWHATVEEYAEAKSNIVRTQKSDDAAVLAADYPRSAAYADLTPAKVFLFSRRHAVARGAWTEDGTFWFSEGAPAKNAAHDDATAYPAAMIGPKEKICPVSMLTIPGEHNWENACAAIAAAKAAGVATPAIVEAIANFRGLAHRIEFVAATNDVRYYNDSYSTAPDAAIVAMETFAAPKVLILGGSSKGSDFGELGRAVDAAATQGGIRAIIGIGAEWPRIREAIHAKDILYKEDCRSMKEIVRAAKDAARPGDVVILSPACASFGMFKNYSDRGDQFREEVLRLHD
jgi:UDP-N-acetylmuramoylalanine--D-glutamate ligase